MNKEINGMKKNHASVLQPLKINQIILPNRIVFPAVQTNYTNPDGTVSNELIHFYSKADL